MKVAVVYFSYNGSCALIAEQLNACLNDDIIRLKLKDEKKRKGFAKYFWGGSMSVLKRKPALKPYNFDPSVYDLIILGTPVWAGSPSSPMRTFLSQTKIINKKLALFLCHAGALGSAPEKFKALLPGNEIVSHIGFQSPGKESSGQIKARVGDWVKTLGIS